MKRFVLATVATLGGFGIAVACGDPYDGEIPPPAEAGTDAAGGEDAPLSSDGGIVELDAPASLDATSDAPSVDANCAPCDCDEDGWITFDAAVCPDPGGKQRADCDDLDSRANPDAGFSTELPTSTTKGDWNCDGKYHYERIINVDCASFNSLSFVCSSLSGFKGDPGCGGTGDYVTCKGPALPGPCVEAAVEKRKQGCR